MPLMGRIGGKPTRQMCSGVYSSGDGGNTWTQVLNVNGSQAYNVIFDTVNSSNVYASIDNNGVYKSTNAGTTWVADNNGGGCATWSDG